MEINVNHSELDRMHAQLSALSKIIGEAKCEMSFTSSKGTVKDSLDDTKKEVEKIGAAIKEVFDKTAKIVDYINKEFKTTDEQLGHKILK